MVRFDMDKFSYGSISGMLSIVPGSNGYFRYVVYDSIFNNIIDCCFDIDTTEYDWYSGLGKRVTISGKVYRNVATGIAVKICDITNFVINKKVPVRNFEAAKGILPWREGDELPEDIIRRIRDM